MITAESNTLELAVVPDEAQMKHVAPWESFEATLSKLKLTAETLKVTDVSQVAEMKLARATRLTLRELRIAIEHRRKELGEHHLRETQRINAGAKALKDLIEPLETRLLAQEEFAERKERERKAALLAARTAEMQPLVSDVSFYNLAEMPDNAYAELLASSKAAAEAKRIAAEKAEAERIALEKARAEEQKRIKAENERLRLEATAREAELQKEREAAERERQRLLQQAEAARAEAQKKAKAAAEKARAAQAELEARAKAERDAAEAIARKERQAREKLEAESAARKAEEARVIAAKKAAEEAAAMAPEKEKLIAMSEDLLRVKIPAMTTKKGREAVRVIAFEIGKLAKQIEAAAADLQPPTIPTTEGSQENANVS